MTSDGLPHQVCVGKCVVHWLTQFNPYDGNAVSTSSAALTVPDGLGAAPRQLQLVLEEGTLAFYSSNPAERAAVVAGVLEARGVGVGQGIAIGPEVERDVSAAADE